MSQLEQHLERQIQQIGLPPPEREYRFAAAIVGEGKGLRARLAASNLKDWRFDYAWPAHSLAVEIEGGAWAQGRHTRGKGFAEDLRKYSAAMKLGWTVYRCDGGMIKNGEAIEVIQSLMQQLGLDLEEAQ